MQEHFDLGREILKWIAVLTMTIDHVGVVLFPEHVVLRFIGRLSFPLFGYLLVLGMESTRNTISYLTRLLLFAFISQVPFYLALGDKLYDPLNILFTLFLGIPIILSFRRKNPLFVLIPLLTSLVLNFDYGIYGIISIGCIYLLTKTTILGIVLLVSLNLGFLLTESPYQVLSILALPFILFHQSGFRLNIENVERRIRYPLWRKYFFYTYYPLHLIMLYLVRAYYF